MKNLSLTRIIFTCLIILLETSGLSLMAQENNTERKTLSREEFVQELKNSALLVRLQDRTNTLAILKEKGLINEAEKLAQQQRLENKETLLSFTQTFDFCPVYFFYAKDSEAIRSGDLQGILFNANLELVPVKLDKYYTAEFAETPDLGIDGLIVMDQRLLSLDNSLPFFERRFVFFNLKERSKAEIVEAYNARMHEYFNFYQSKKKAK
ncbi:MAG: hypothetical protein DA405_04560 [Bacteroidetes bacterium]|nr:MAG: hypothetical protein DA405_04560 [Bacteroidota bacterium]